jgi:hypothetical protein
MVGGKAGHARFGGQVVQLDVVGYRWAQEDHVGLLLCQRGSVIDEVEVDRLDGNARVSVLQQAEDGTGVRHGSFGSHGACDEPSGSLPQLRFGNVLEPVDSRDCRPDFRRQGPPCFGHGDRPVCALHYTHPQAFLQFSDLLA